MYAFFHRRPTFDLFLWFAWMSCCGLEYEKLLRHVSYLSLLQPKCMFEKSNCFQRQWDSSLPFPVAEDSSFRPAVAYCSNWSCFSGVKQQPLSSDGVSKITSSHLLTRSLYNFYWKIIIEILWPISGYQLYYPATVIPYVF